MVFYIKKGIKMKVIIFVVGLGICMLFVMKVILKEMFIVVDKLLI